jgi:hypothetical protein
MRLAFLIFLLCMSPMAHAEPVTAAVAVFAAWAGTTAATVYLVAAAVVMSAGMAVYGSAQARRAERDAKSAANAAMQDRMATRIATEAPHRYIYGRAKVGADIVAMFSSGDKDQFKHLVCVHAAHECDAIEEIYVNNVAVGLLNSAGDVITGRFATNPDYEIMEERLHGPTFTLSKFPKSGSLWVFVGEGADMERVAIVRAVGKIITIEENAAVVVSYEYGASRGFADLVNSQEVTFASAVRVRKHLGGPDDPADSYLMSVVPDKWTAAAVLRGMCYTVITLDLNYPEFQGGQVPIHALVRGKKLYDPRDGQTRWSQNVALATYDYLTSPLCGVPASDLPAAQFITAANVCDETSVAGGRYTINGTVTSDQAQSNVLETMAQAMAGGIVSTTWEVYAGTFTAPVIALQQSDIVGALSITPGASDAAIYNGVKGQYISDENDYVLTDFAPYQNSTYLDNDGRDLYTNIDFPFTDSLQRVTNLARIFTEDQRNGFTLQADFSLKAWSLKVGQRVSFTSEFLGQSAKVYRLTDKSYSPTSAVQLTLKEDDESIWDFADSVVIDATPNTNLPDPWKVDALAALECTSGQATLLRQPDGSTLPRILATWPASTNQSVFLNGQIEIEWAAITSGVVQRIVVSGSETQAYLSPITPGWFYLIRARCVDPYLNVKSAWVATTYQVNVFSARPTVYKWAETKPDAPMGSTFYDWATQSFAIPDGYTAAITAAPASGGVSLWSAEVLVTDVTIDAPTYFNWAEATVRSGEYAETPGNSNFTWTKYATSAAGAGLNDSPTGMTYIGMAFNKTTAVESTNPADYTWALFKGTDGAAGVKTGTARLYQWGMSAPALPTGTSSFSWASLANSGYSASDGWAINLPANPGTPLLRPWTVEVPVTAAASATTTQVTQAAYAAAVARAWSQNGATGAAGIQSKEIKVFQWAATIPAAPSGTGALSWATGLFGGAPANWALAPGAAIPGYTQWSAKVTVTDTAGATSTPFNWSTASVGAETYAGGDGLSYVTAYVATTVGTASTAPTATTGRASLPAANSSGLTGTPQATVPALTAGQYLMQFDGIYNPATNQVTWSIPYVSSLKVGSLSAQSTNTGALTVTGLISSANGKFGVDANGALTSSAATFKTDAGVVMFTTGTGLTIEGAPTGTLNSALTPAINASTDALTAIGSDYVLDKSEKPRVIIEFTTIDTERAGVAKQATDLGISAATYQGTINTLAAFLTNNVGSSTTDWSNVLIDSPYDGPYMRDRFVDVYRERQKLLDAVAAKLQANAAAAASAASTADGKAVSAATAASNAAQAAAAAAQTANTARDAITAIGSDGILDKSEKPRIITEFTTIDTERAGIAKQATDLGISAATYQGTINTLAAFLTNNVGSSTTDWSNVLIDSPYDGPYMRDRFVDVYRERQKLLDAVAAKLQANAAAAATTATAAGISGQMSVPQVASFLPPGGVTNVMFGGDLYSSNWNGLTGTGGAGWYLQRTGNFFGFNVILRGALMSPNMPTFGFWPAAGAGNVTYYGPEGIQLGNYTDGKYVYFAANGDVDMPGFRLVNKQITITNAILVTPRINTTFAITIPGINAMNQVNTSTFVSFGTFSASMVNGVAPFRRQWTLSVENGNPNDIRMVGDPTGESVQIQAKGNGTYISAYLSLTVTDANQATAGDGSSIAIQFGNGQPI